MLRKLVLLLGAFVTLISAGFATDAGADADRQSINAIDQQYIKAFNSKNIAVAMQDFADDAVYFTDYGKTLRGKAEIQAELDKQFKNTGDATLELKVYNVEFSPDRKSAKEYGVSVVTEDGIEEPSSYVAEFTKQGDKWKLSKVTETAQAPTTEKIQPLAWMIGDWADESEEGSLRTKVEWSLDRAYIVRRFAVSGMGLRDLKGIEYIGWNPATQQITSWYFDSDGGYGNGKWRQEGSRWIDETTGMTPAGEVASATHIYMREDDNSFTLRAVNRKVGDEKLDDVAEVKIKRINEKEKDKDAVSAAPRGQL